MRTLGWLSTGRLLFRELDDEATLYLRDFQLPRRLALVLLILGLVVHIASITNLWNPVRDGAAYLGVGRSLAAGEGMYFNGAYRNFYSPGVPLLWAGIISLFGEQMWLANTIMMVMALVTVWATYALFSRLAGRGMGQVIALMVLLSYTCFSRATRIETDLPFLMFLTLSLWCWQLYFDGRGLALLLAILLLLAGIVFRIPGLMIVPSLILGLGLERTRTSRLRKWLGIGIGGMILAILALAWLVSQKQLEVGGYVASTESRLSQGWQSLASQVAIGLYETPNGLVRLISDWHGPSWCVMPVAAVMVLGALHEVRHGRRAVVVMFAGYIATLALLAGSHGTSGRYLMPLLPWAFYYLMLGGITILVRVRRSFPRAPLQRVLLVVILALMGVGVGKDIRDLVRIHRSPGPWVARNHWLEVQALTEWVEENTKLSETILLREAVVVACWSGRLTFELNIRAPDLSQEVLAKLSVTRPDYFVIRDDRLDSAALEPAALPRLTQVGRYTIYKPQGQTR